MKTNLTHPIARSIAATLALGLVAVACGGSDAAGTEASGGGDEIGGPGRWTPSQLCALSTTEAVSLQFSNSKIDERAGNDDPNWTSCSWRDQSDLYEPAQMSISQYGGFAADGLGADIDLDIVGADMAGYSDNIGGAASVSAVVGDQLLDITFPVGTEGAQEFGTVIASTWVAVQAGE